MASRLGDDDAVERLVYEVTLALAAAGPDQLLFHAAAVAQGKRGLLLPGPSGTGKSTLAAWLAASGFDLLSDELCAVRPGDTGLAGFPRPLNLKDRSISLEHPRWPGGPVEPRRPGELSTRLVAIVFPKRRSGAETAVARLTPADAAFRLLPCLTNRGRWPRAGVDALAELARRVPAYELVYAEAERAVRAVEEIGAADRDHSVTLRGACDGNVAEMGVAACVPILP